VMKKRTTFQSAVLVTGAFVLGSCLGALGPDGIADVRGPLRGGPAAVRPRPVPAGSTRVRRRPLPGGPT
jgi:hypothetical protein